MKTIKIIDLLTKIANGEEVPKKIKYLGDKFIWNNELLDYCFEEDNLDFNGLFDKYMITKVIFDEVEILDVENEFEDIEEKDVYIKLCSLNWKREQEVELIDNLTRFNLAINKIIRNQKKIIERLKDE